jgi:hypothetical protein
MRHVGARRGVVLVVTASDPGPTDLRLVLLLSVLHHLHLLSAQWVGPLGHVHVAGPFRTIEHLLVSASVAYVLLIFLKLLFEEVSLPGSTPHLVLIWLVRRERRRTVEHHHARDGLTTLHELSDTRVLRRRV